MSKYKPAFLLDQSNRDQHIQTGQWVYLFPDQTVPSRYVGHDQHYWNIVHPRGAFMTLPFPSKAFLERARQARAER